MGALLFFGHGQRVAGALANASQKRALSFLLSPLCAARTRRSLPHQRCGRKRQRRWREADRPRPKSPVPIRSDRSRAVGVTIDGGREAMFLRDSSPHTAPALFKKTRSTD
jgi:hypothetical protein